MSTQPGGNAISKSLELSTTGRETEQVMEDAPCNLEGIADIPSGSKALSIMKQGKHLAST